MSLCPLVAESEMSNRVVQTTELVFSAEEPCTDALVLSTIETGFTEYVEVKVQEYCHPSITCGVKHVGSHCDGPDTTHGEQVGSEPTTRRCDRWGGGNSYGLSFFLLERNGGGGGQTAVSRAALPLPRPCLFYDPIFSTQRKNSVIRFLSLFQTYSGYMWFFVQTQIFSNPPCRPRNETSFGSAVSSTDLTRITHFSFVSRNLQLYHRRSLHSHKTHAKRTFRNH